MLASGVDKMNKALVEQILRWLESDYDLRHKKGLKKAWLDKAIGISGHNQTKGAIKALKYIIAEWQE